MNLTEIIVAPKFECNAGHSHNMWKGVSVSSPHLLIRIIFHPNYGEMSKEWAVSCEQLSIQLVSTQFYKRQTHFSAALVISGTPPIRLQIEDRARTYGKDEDTKRQEKEETIRKWQREWEDTVKVGQWTKRLIPNVATWTNRKHGNVDYYLTQMLSGHGCFAAYLHKFALIESDICWYCQERDDAAHTFLHCIRWTRERTIVETAIGETLSTENITNTMIDSKEGWDVIAQMAKGIISKKEEEERTRKRQLQGQE
ncbi:hypothetical protein NQ318_018671 [Aromia moschata]|uniref:Reverse transcriptase zinc-binding domain-containing protein n=1 Tax=Aromia moschata TaxID=1265417 RepID=A0AAV8ZGZ0_9CUCU|nr:hypothetical protein NQ318_018671 [Aromia moschata]